MGVGQIWMEKIELIKKYKNKIFAVIFALFSLFPFCIDMSVVDAETLDTYSGRFNIIFHELRLSFNGNSMLLLLLFVLFYNFYYNYINKKSGKIQTLPLFLACIYSAILILGGSFYRTASWYEVFGCSAAQRTKAVLVYLGMFITCYFALSCLLDYIEKEKPYTGRRRICEYSLNSILMTWLIILLCWMPYIIIKYPGITAYDTGTALKWYFDDHTVTDGVPAFTVLYFVSYIKLGNLLGSQNIGLSLFVGVQSLTMSFCLSYFICYLGRCRVVYIYRISMLIGVCVLPLYPYTAMQMGSDVPYTITIILYTLFLVRFIWKNEKIKWYEWIFEIFVLSLMALFRHTGIYIVIISAIVLCISKRRNFKVFSIHAAAIAVYLIWCTFILPALLLNGGGSVYDESMNAAVQQAGTDTIKSVDSGNTIAEKKEQETHEEMESNNESEKSFSKAISELLIKMSRMLLYHTGQQMANYVKNYYNELSETEIQILRRLIEVEKIADTYNPELTDNIVGIMKVSSVSEEEIIEYLKLWVRLFFRHPSAYIQATMNMWYGYFYPDYTCKTKTYIFYELRNVSDSDHLNIHYTNQYAYERGLIDAWKDVGYRLPIIGTFYGIGIYTWMGIFSMAYIVWRRKWEAVLLMSPVILTLLVCMVSPVCGYTRYAFPIMFCMPLLFALWFTYENEAVDEI